MTTERRRRSPVPSSASASGTGLIAMLLLTVIVAIHAGNADTGIVRSVSVGTAGADYPTLKAAIERAPADVGLFLLDAGIFIESGITVSRDAVIRGSGRRKTMLRGAEEPGAAPARILTIAEGHTVLIEHLTVENGVARETLRRGGGILNLGTLRMDSCVLRSNAAVYGAGLDNRGRATILRSEISGNTVLPMNIEERTTGLGCTGSGGGIKNEPGSVLSMEDCLLEGNSALAKGGGLFIACESRAFLKDCRIRENAADRGGGGIFIRGDLTLVDSRVTNNRSRAGAGGIDVNGYLDFTGNIVRRNSRNDIVLGTGSAGIYGAGVIGIDEGNRIGVQ